MKGLLRRLGFVESAVTGAEEQPIHVLHSHLVVVNDDELSNSTSHQHLGSNAPNAPNTHDDNRFLPNLFVILCVRRIDEEAPGRLPSVSVRVVGCTVGPWRGIRV